MKKSGLVAVVMVAGMLLAVVRAYAVEDSVACGMVEKGSHGLVNVATGWWEIPLQIKKGYDDGMPKLRDKPAASRSLGMLCGVFRGAGHAVGRTAWGVIQLTGFWSRNPTDNSHLMQLLDAEYSWQEGTKKPMRCPTLDDGFNRVGQRFERGVRNLVGSVSEIPGQIRKSDRERRVYVGLPKGLWFAASRAWYGVGDMGMFPVPGPEKNLGVPFEEVEAWDALQENYYNNVR